MNSNTVFALFTRKHAPRFGLLAMILGLQAGCATLGPPPPLPVSEVVSMSKAGVAPDQVIADLRGDKTVYAPRGSDFGKLAELGVKPKVLNYIQDSFVNEIELLTRYYALGDSLGGCRYCYPPPLELSTLALGRSGMSANVPTGDYTAGGRPPGVPNWVPASPNIAFRAAPGITVDDISKRAKEGASAEELVRQIRNSRLEGLIAQGGLRLGTRSSVGLSGSELATLRHQGVPDSVLDALQGQYLAQFIEFERLRFQNLGNGPGFM